MARVDDRLTVALVPVASTLDLKALGSASAGKRAAGRRGLDVELDPNALIDLTAAAIAPIARHPDP